jgi:hypothetical protein
VGLAGNTAHGDLVRVAGGREDDVESPFITVRNRSAGCFARTKSRRLRLYPAPFVTVNILSVDKRAKTSQLRQWGPEKLLVRAEKLAPKKGYI